MKLPIKESTDLIWQFPNLEKLAQNREARQYKVKHSGQNLIEVNK